MERPDIELMRRGVDGGYSLHADKTLLDYIDQLEAAIEKMCEWNCGLGYAAGECGALGCPIHPHRRAE